MTTPKLNNKSNAVVVNPEIAELLNLRGDGAANMVELTESSREFIKLQEGETVTCYICGIETVPSKFKNKAGEMKADAVLMQVIDEQTQTLKEVLCQAAKLVGFTKNFFAKNPQVEKFPLLIECGEMVEGENGQYLNMKFFTSKI